jgi:hypothetical protein
MAEIRTRFSDPHGDIKRDPDIEGDPMDPNHI